MQIGQLRPQQLLQWSKVVSMQAHVSVRETRAISGKNSRTTKNFKHLQNIAYQCYHAYLAILGGVGTSKESVNDKTLPSHLDTWDESSWRRGRFGMPDKSPGASLHDLKREKHHTEQQFFFALKRDTHILCITAPPQWYPPPPSPLPHPPQGVGGSSISYLIR